jgi:SAM-dependent methyltransferase
MLTRLKKYLYKKYRPFKLKKEFNKDFSKYNMLAEQTNSQKARKEEIYPCLYDKTLITNIEPIYFYQDSWAFEQIFKNKPDKHFDIGSHHKFVAHLSKVVDLTMVDIRPLALPMESIKFLEGSILDLPFKDSSINSLSSLCVVEHIGLGRYGDPIDPLGSEKAFSEIDRVLSEGANFYFSVPVENTNKIYFNAHRAFNEDYLFEKILHNYTIIDKKYIYDNEYQTELRPEQFGIGCYHVKKIIYGYS